MSTKFYTSTGSILLFLVITFVNVLAAQELPPIQSFTPQEYQGENQNWAITQGWDNHIYIANNHNLLEYDGVRWSNYSSPNASIFRSVKAKDSLIFTGQYMEFGYWKKNSYADLTYTSISSQLKEPMVDDEEFWNIIVLDDWVLFQSLDRIYSYNLKKNLFKVLNVQSTKAQIFEVDDTVYFQSQNFGIYKIGNGSPELVINDELLRDKSVVGIYKEDGELLIILDNAQFLKTQDGILFTVKMETNTVLEGLNIYCTERLSDGSFVLGTISKGIYHIDKDGKLLRTIDQRKGLNNNTILSIYQDKDDNLWLGLDNGLSVVNINSRFNEYLDNLGRLGLVYTSQFYNENLYLGTNQGLFLRHEESEGDFKMIAGTEGQVWSLDLIDGTLFCGHNKGTYVVKGDNATLISKLPGTWGVKVFDEASNILIQGNYDGLSFLKKQEGNWIFANKISGFDTSSRFFEVMTDQKILVNHEYKGLFELTLDKENQKVLHTESHPIMGYGSSIAKYQGDIVYVSLDGAFVKLTDSLAFEADENLNNLLFDAAGGVNGILLPDEKAERLWCFTENGLSYIYPRTFNASLNIDIIPIPDFFRHSLGVSGFENLTHIKDEQYLIGVSNGFVMLDVDKVKDASYSVSINDIYTTSALMDVTKMSMDSGQEIDFDENSIYFDYSVPQYNKYTEVSYQYRLMGLFEEWSVWSSGADVTFTNLDYGDYTFMVRAKVGNILTKNVAKFDFTVKTPWYLSIVAFVFYFLGLIIVFFTIHRLYNSYYTKKQNRLLELEKKKLKRNKLKTEKELIQVRNEKLQSEIDSKNRELAISTMSIVKKNQFLNAIKEDLNKVEKSNQIKSIIKTINNNIENEDDWKYFEEAFNNTDKDFLHTLLEKHPNLTNNDLKLCAYLRLNLTSKEIAPLLNISIKSVEVKRYRLRKKMNLPHKSGLTEYIISL